MGARAQPPDRRRSEPPLPGRPSADADEPGRLPVVLLVGARHAARAGPFAPARLAAALERSGLEARIAQTEAEAMSLMPSLRPALVLLQVAGEGDLRAVSALREAGCEAPLAVIEPPGALPDTAVRAIVAGADVCLPSGVEDAVLAQAIGALAVRGARARAAQDARIRLQAGIEAVPIGVMLVDRRLRIVGANRRLTEMGLAAPRPWGRPLSEALAGKAGVRIAALARAVLKSGGERAARFEVAGPSGPVHLEVRGHPVSEARAGVDGVGITVQDVTELERLLAQLRESERRWHAVLDSDRTGVALRDAEGRLITCNEAYARIYGAASAAELIGTDLRAILAPADAEDAIRRFRERWSAGPDAETHFDGVYRLASGESVAIHSTISIVRDESGQPLYQLALLENRTEERRLQEELSRAQRIDAIGRLAGGVAHDVNNMLAVILGYTELIAARLGEDHELRGDLAEIARAAEHSRALARDLLAFGRRQLLERRPLAPAEVIGDLRSLLQRTLGPGMRLSVEDRSDGAVVIGDRAQLETAIINLVANARDAMPLGGEVSVSIDVAKPAHAGDPGAVEISVCDSGVGMAEDVRERIFEPFFTTKELGQGSGLGLATVLGVVEQMGGRITVDSELGRGTTFRISLPRAVDRRPAGAEAAARAAHPSAGASILVVEDEPQLLALLRRVLEAAGHTVLSAADGARALALLDDGASPCDLLLTDMLLPDTSGVELARAALERRPGIRVLYTSGYAADAALARSAVPGDGFIAKPYATAELLAVVDRALRRRAGARPGSG
ncbi:MAG TPA: ATP-binding protein [Solirubrobacteraceae bacterium]|nr:ATP-binding protein [Solirubrobacteraceae bacterium]